MTTEETVETTKELETALLEIVRMRIAEKLVEIEEFLPGEEYKLTLVVRNVDQNKQSIIVTNDYELKDVVTALQAMELAEADGGPQEVSIAGQDNPAANPEGTVPLG